MEKFQNLLERANLLHEAASENRGKALDFKAKMKPVIKKVKHAEIGDARRYAYMLLWPFLRDVVGIDEMQGQKTPANSALIQRKLEELSDAGRLPEGSAEEFEKYALAEFDQFVNHKAATRPTYKGDTVGIGSEAESPAERAERNRVAAELAKQQEMEERKKQRESGEPYIKRGQIPAEFQGVRKEFENVISDIKQSLQTRFKTTLVEVFVDPNEGPIFNKSQLIKLIDPNDLADEIEVEANKIIFELKPESRITQMVQQRGAEAVEQALTNAFEQALNRAVKVIVHAPEEDYSEQEHQNNVPQPPTEPQNQSLDDLEGPTDSDLMHHESYTASYLPEDIITEKKNGSTINESRTILTRDRFKPTTHWQVEGYQDLMLR